MLTIESSLKRCLERGYCILDDEMCGLLNKQLGAVVNALHATYPQEKYPGNGGRFERSREVAVILASILTAEDESAFRENLSFRKHKVSSVENSSSDAIELEGLKANVTKAQSLLDESDNFIRRQRLKIKI